MVTAIVLAAGLSKRMGTANKLLLPYKNKTVLATVVANILASGMEEVIIVTGHEAKQIEQSLKDLPVRFIYNPEYEKGMTTSIQQGVSFASGNGYMICLSDMVLIEPAEYALLKNTFEQQLKNDKKCICMPRYKNEKGNPVILSSFYKEPILKHQEMEGCKQIVQLNKTHIHWVKTERPHVLQDMDYPEDYKKLNATNI